jgi:hypothetical protein
MRPPAISGSEHPASARTVGERERADKVVRRLQPAVVSDEAIGKDVLPGASSFSDGPSTVVVGDATPDRTQIVICDLMGAGSWGGPIAQPEGSPDEM